MPTWLLLAFVYCIGFAFLLAAAARRRSQPAAWLLGGGLALFALGLLAEIVLAFAFDPAWLKLFYLGRAMLSLALLGQGALLLVRDPGRWRRWLAAGMLAGALLAVGLVAITGISQAATWFDPARPLYGQYADILQTNRVTRGLVWAFNLYGAAALLATPALSRPRPWLPLGLAVLGLAAWLYPLLASPAHYGPGLYAAELAAPLLLFAALWLWPGLERAP